MDRSESSVVAQCFRLLAERLSLQENEGPSANLNALFATAATEWGPLPEDVREYFTRLQALLVDRRAGLFYGLEALPLATALGERKQMLRLCGETWTPTERSVPEGAVSLAWFEPGWLPIAHDYSGCYLAVDFCPGPAGSRGQVVNIGGRERVKYVLFSSISDFCQSLLDNDAAGRMVYSVGPDEAWVELVELTDPNGCNHLVDFVAERGLDVLRPSRSSFPS